MKAIERDRCPSCVQLPCLTSAHTRCKTEHVCMQHVNVGAGARTHPVLVCIVMHDSRMQHEGITVENASQYYWISVHYGGCYLNQKTAVDMESSLITSQES